VVRALAIIAVAASPAVLMRVVADLRAGGPVTDRAIALATLNTLYALTLGTAMRTIDRGEGTLAASLAYSLTVLGLSALVGAVLAAVLTIALRLLRRPARTPSSWHWWPRRGRHHAAGRLGAAGGAAGRPAAGAPAPWVWPRQLGTAASMLSI
jgi:hypothetical protein